MRSTFYFIAGAEPGDPDYRYRLSDPRFAGLLRRIDARGHEVGLHGSYASYRSADRLRIEADALQDACRAAGVERASWGVRQHYLRFEAPTTWRHQAAAGLVHDSTVGYPEEVGFRAGTCRPFPVFDLLAGEPTGLIERPLIAMDGTLFGYLGLGADEASERIRALADACRPHGGELVLLYHNHTVATPAMLRHYRDLVATISNLGAAPS